MIKTLANPTYYLDNFLHVVEWVVTRYAALLSAEERARLDALRALPRPSQALLVRMIMRKGPLFRRSKLVYAEIGDIDRAAEPLLAQCWLDGNPALGLEPLFALLRKAEIVAAFATLAPYRHLRKSALRELLENLPQACGHDSAERLAQETPDVCAKTDTGRFDAVNTAVRPLAVWWPDCDDRVYALAADLAPLCDRLRLMYFGNLHQDWSEFVLAELGVFNYEAVALDAATQAFDRREQIDAYLFLHACRRRFDEGEDATQVAADIARERHSNAWVERRRARLLFRIAQCHEQAGALDIARRLYADCHWPGARARTVRVLERDGRTEAAFALAQAALAAPESETEHQQLTRSMPRLRRLLGHARQPVPAVPPPARHDLLLPHPAIPARVETIAAQHLCSDEAPVLYVENALINSLFGLLFWEAIFAPLPGAFFHPFQSGPADLHEPDFGQRRAALFAQRFALLDGGDVYRDVILRNYQSRQGLQSPFVFWGAIDTHLLTLALDCMPPLHLRRCFERLLQDIAANRSGLPDLIQFWPAQRRYRMIEVKGPGDRLQDNQLRWLRYFGVHDIPVTVCYVRWQAPPDAAALRTMASAS